MIHGYGGSTSPDTRASRVLAIAIEESGGTPPPAVTVADYAFTGCMARDRRTVPTEVP